MAEKTEVRIGYGILMPPIKKQLEEQGFALKDEDCEIFEKVKDAANRLRFNDFITEGEVDKVFRRINKSIAKKLEHLAKKEE